MITWMATQQKWFKNHRAVAALGLMIALAAGAYGIFKPAPASASSAAPPAVALDDNSVSALLTLDRAMETLAAHVTPAVVNVTVAARHKPQVSDGDQEPGDIQRFFGPFGFGQKMPPTP